MHDILPTLPPLPPLPPLLLLLLLLSLLLLLLCLNRLAIVPMSQEARGLDAGQRLATRLVGCGDNRSASIVSRIAEEERAHVAVGEFTLYDMF
jgi:hypothetical protein